MDSWIHFLCSLYNEPKSTIFLQNYLEKYWSEPKYPLSTILLMGGHDIVVILKEFAIYPSSKVKELSNGTQQAPLGTFTQSAKIHKV